MKTTFSFVGSSGIEHERFIKGLLDGTQQLKVNLTNNDERARDLPPIGKGKKSEFTLILRINDEKLKDFQDLM